MLNIFLVRNNLNRPHLNGNLWVVQFHQVRPAVADEKRSIQNGKDDEYDNYN